MGERPAEEVTDGWPVGVVGVDEHEGRGNGQWNTGGSDDPPPPTDSPPPRGRRRPGDEDFGDPDEKRLRVVVPDEAVPPDVPGGQTHRHARDGDDGRQGHAPPTATPTDQRGCQRGDRHHRQDRHHRAVVERNAIEREHR